MTQLSYKRTLFSSKYAQGCTTRVLNHRSPVSVTKAISFLKPDLKPDSEMDFVKLPFLNVISGHPGCSLLTICSDVWMGAGGEKSPFYTSANFDIYQGIIHGCFKRRCATKQFLGRIAPCNGHSNKPISVPLSVVRKPCSVQFTNKQYIY